MILGAASACLFYLCLFYAQSLWQIYSLQLLNGLAVGITACLGIVIIQNMMPQQMGLATTLFNNCLMIASLMSSISVGIIAEFKDYHSVILGMIGGGKIKRSLNKRFFYRILLTCCAMVFNKGYLFASKGG